MGDIEDVLKHVCEEKLSEIILKSQQEEPFYHFGKDVFVVLATEFGKSFIYQSFVFALDHRGYFTSKHRERAVEKR